MEWVRVTLARASRPGARRRTTAIAAAAVLLASLIVPLGLAADDASAASELPAAVTPKLSAGPRVGGVITATIAPSKPAADGRLPRLELQWLRNGKRIGASSTRAGVAEPSYAQYAVQPGDLTAVFKLRITQFGENIASLTKKSPASEPVAPGTFKKLSPRISGEALLGKPLTLKPLKPSVGTVSVVWLRDGKRIGATGLSYTPALRDLGARISATVTQTREGFTTVTETTARTRAISSRILTAATPKVSGTVKTGNTLTVKRGSWTRGTAFTYQWYAAGKKLSGATKKKLKLTRAHRGKLIKVKVTGTKPKYQIRSVASAPARIAGLRGPRNSNGWAWPTDTREFNQGYHEGYAVDIGTTSGGPLFAPYQGVVVQVGGDGFGKPGFCPTSWWRGTNQTVVIRHSYQGKTVYSAVNHVAAGSSRALGITVGTRVRAGQQIATEGMSGCTSGPHIHFVMRKTQFNWNGELKPERYIGKPKARRYNAVGVSPGGLGPVLPVDDSLVR